MIAKTEQKNKMIINTMTEAYDFPLLTIINVNHHVCVEMNRRKKKITHKTDWHDNKFPTNKMIQITSDKNWNVTKKKNARAHGKQIAFHIPQNCMRITLYTNLKLFAI